MSVIKLGTDPDSLIVVLPKNADFKATLRNITSPTDHTPVNWPAGTAIQLRFGSSATPVMWAATVTGADAVFNVDKAVVAPLRASETKVARLYYVNGTDDILWAEGDIRRP